MIYREWLVMRKAGLVFLGIVFVLQLLFTIGAAQHGKYHAEFGDMFPSGAWFVACFATIFGVALGSASREGARTFWVLPQSRVRSALEVVGVDLAAIVALTAFVIVLNTAVTVGVIELLPTTNAFVWRLADWHTMIAPFFLALAVYGWSALVGMVGRRVPYVGVAVLPMLFIWSASANFPGPMAGVLRVPIIANPVAIYSYPGLIGSGSGGHLSDVSPLLAPLAWLTPDLMIVVLATTAVAGCVLAIAMWARAEVLA